MSTIPKFVQCVNAIGMEYYFDKGKIYSPVTYILGAELNYEFAHCPMGIHVDRFIPLPDDIEAHRTSDPIIRHKVKSVSVCLDTYAALIVFAGKDGYTYLQYGFNFTWGPEQPNAVESAKHPLTESACWRAMRPKMYAGQCPCGINRVDCQYHK